MKKNTLPLRGIQILDFSRHLPGPFATFLLQKWGAKVIRVVKPEDDEVLSFPNVMKGKSKIEADLKNPKALFQIKNLTKKSDVLIESFRPGVMEKLGIGFRDISKLNPRIIYASLNSYGSKDKRAGHDLNYLADSGMLRAVFPEHTKVPGLPLADLIGGLSAAFQISTFLNFPKKKRKAVHLDIPITETVSEFVHTLDPAVKQTMQKVAAGHLARYHVYQCKDKKELVVACLEEKFWTKFVQHLNIPPNILNSHEGKIVQWLIKHFKSKTQKEWLKILSDPDLCVSPVNT